MKGLESKRYKMVFCDIDGTLLDSRNQISIATKRKIRSLASIGIPFVLVSARMPSGILPVQKELGIASPVICYNGALITDERGECVKTAGIGVKQAICIESFIRKNAGRVCLSAYSYDKWITDNISDKWIVREREITSSTPEKGKITDFISPEGHIHKFLCMGDAVQIARLCKEVKEHFALQSVCLSKDTYLEIMEGGVTKSGAVKYLCGKYGIPIEDTVSFGDNFNDVDMLLATGVGFAMGNAPEAVKMQAGSVTLDNNSEGVLAGLEQLNFLSIGI